MIIGIDPGTATGALAALDALGAAVWDLPVHLLAARGRGPRTTLDLAGLHRRLAELGKIAHAYIELVGPMPKQGIVSTWRFAEAYGALRGLIVAMGIPHTLVQPRAWQRFHGIGGEPDAARRRAVELFPEVAGDLARKKDAHRADALLIAAYGRSASTS